MMMNVTTYGDDKGLNTGDNDHNNDDDDSNNTDEDDDHDKM